MGVFNSILSFFSICYLILFFSFPLYLSLSSWRYVLLYWVSNSFRTEFCLNIIIHHSWIEIKMKRHHGECELLRFYLTVKSNSFNSNNPISTCKSFLFLSVFWFVSLVSYTFFSSSSSSFSSSSTFFLRNQLQFKSLTQLVCLFAL